MMLPLDTLITPMTEEEVLERFIALLETLGIPARLWRKAGSLRTILRVVSIIYSQFTILMAAAIKSGFLDYAEGPWLTLLAYYVYGVERKPATFATGEITLTNNGGGIFSKGIGEYRVLKSISATEKKAYVNTAPFTLNPGESIKVPIQAVEVGSVSSAGPGEIDEQETTLYEVTVTNELAVWGADEESDPELRTVCRAKLASISVRGPRGAYEYAALRATRPDGSYVDINRVAISRGSSKGKVTMYCASPSGAPLSTDIDYVSENVEKVARPDSVTKEVLAASNVALARSLTIWAIRTDGVSADDLKSLAEKKLEIAMRAYKIGGIAKPPSTQGYLYADYIAGVVKSAHDSIFDVDGTGDDLPLNPGQVAVLSTEIDVRLVEAA